MRSRIAIVGALVLGVAGGCGGGTASVDPPAGAVSEYGRAVQSRDAEAMWALLDEETRARVTPADLRRLLSENEAELGEQASLLGQAASRGVQARARVPLETGETVVLVLEDGVWRVDGGVLDAPSLRTPRDAVVALRRALQRRSMPGVERVLARQPRAELDAELRRFIEETADELDLEYEIRGNNARVRTSAGREILLVREAGEWKVLEVR